jgi:hypothetical protein
MLPVLGCLRVVGYELHGDVAGRGLRGGCWNEVDSEAVSRVVRDIFRQTISEAVDLLELVRDDDGLPDAVRGSLEARFEETEQKIGRLVGALVSGAHELLSVHEALAQLERERHSLKAELARVRSKIRAVNPADLKTMVDGLVDSLHHLPEVLAACEPNERKAVVRAFLQEIRIKKTTRQAVLHWHRLPRIGESLKLVELGCRT